MAKMNLNRGFALTRQLIDDHENGYTVNFANILLDHEDFVSGKLK